MARQLRRAACRQGDSTGVPEVHVDRCIMEPTLTAQRECNRGTSGRSRNGALVRRMLGQPNGLGVSAGATAQDHAAHEVARCGCDLTEADLVDGGQHAAAATPSEGSRVIRRIDLHNESVLLDIHGPEFRPDLLLHQHDARTEGMRPVRR